MLCLSAFFFLKEKHRHCDLLVISDMDVHFCPIGPLRWWKDATSLEVKCLYRKNSQGKYFMPYIGYAKSCLSAAG